MNSAPNRGTRQGSDPSGFTIESETTMLELPRGKQGDVFRLTFTKATTPDGKPTAWHSLRVYFRAQDGSMRPSKTGVTIRGSELAPVLRALAPAAGARLVKAT